MLEKILGLAEWHERLRDTSNPSGPSYRMHKNSAAAIRALVEVVDKVVAAVEGIDDGDGKWHDPGHNHEHPGVWDDTKKKCASCKRFIAAKEAIIRLCDLNDGLGVSSQGLLDKSTPPARAEEE